MIMYSCLALNLFNEFIYWLFIVVFVNGASTPASGCSIDKSVGLIKQIEQDFGVNMFDKLLLTYRDGSEIKGLKMADFKEQLKQGNLSANTIVFNNMVTHKDEFVNNWEAAVKASWHKQLL